MPVQSFTTHGETAVFSLKSHSSDHIVIGPVANHRWQLSLNQSVPLRLNVKEIFGRQDLNLKSLKVENLNTENIFGDTSLTLPESGSMQGKVNSVFGSLIIHVPANTPVRLQIEHVFGGVTHPNDFIQEGKTFISPAAKTSSTPINLEVSGVFGSIIIQYLK
jgi:predicted membrane protein